MNWKQENILSQTNSGFKLLRYLSLSKPRIIVLLSLTGVVGFLIPNGQAYNLLDIIVFVFCGYMSAGGAMTVNNYIDRDIDVLMDRTKNRSSVGAHAINPPEKVLVFGSAMAGIGILVGWLWFNWLTAAFLAWGVLFYLFGYSLFLKRKSMLNTILGGLASPAPVWAGYAARTGTMPWQGWLLGALVFIWTPSHTWALSSKYMKDYAAAKIPMLPVKYGLATTAKLTMVFGIAALIYGNWLAFYLIPTVLIFLILIIPDLLFLYGLWEFLRHPDVFYANRCFKLHNLWLGLVFTIIAVSIHL